MDNRMLPRDISFSHNGEAIVAVLIDDPPAGGWTLEEMCSICKEPLGNYSFYTTYPLLVYIHADCAAAAVSPPTFQSRSLSAEQSRIIPHFPSAPPPNVTSYPSYHYNSYPSYQPYNHNYPTNYPSYHYNSYPSDQSYNHNYPTNYPSYPSYHYNGYPPPYAASSYASSSSSSSSSVPDWARLAVTTVVGSFLQAFFSSLVT